MNQYTVYKIKTNDELMVAQLYGLGFEAFQEEIGYTHAYIQSNELDTNLKSEILQIIKSYTHEYEIEILLPQNWNEVWESAFRPVIVGDFCCIRADFHEHMENVKYNIVINPKMAFGTGHHATTHMMVDQMSTLNFDNKCVLDFGCGTSVLAILASKMGAKDIDANDIELPAFENSLENITINNVHNIQVFHGGIEIVPFRSYQIILANINRNVLLTHIDELYKRLEPKGYLLLSGVLEQDENMIIDAFTKSNFKHTTTHRKDGWVCILLEKIEDKNIII